MTMKGHFLLRTQNLHGVTVIYAIYLLIGAFKADYILNIRSYIHQITHRPDSTCYVMHVRVYGFFLKQTSHWIQNATYVGMVHIRADQNCIANVYQKHYCL